MEKLHLDLFCQDKYLLNDVDLKTKLRRNRDAFALVADAANYKIKIKEMALYVRKVQLRFFSRWYVTEKSFYVSPVGIHAGRWQN